MGLEMDRKEETGRGKGRREGEVSWKWGLLLAESVSWSMGAALGSRDCRGQTELR